MFQAKRHLMLWGVVPAIQAVHVVVFPVTFAMVGHVVGVIPTSSIMLAAWLLGMRAAVLAAVCAVASNTLLFIAVGDDLDVALRASALASALFLVVGSVITRMRTDKQRIERLTMFDALTSLPNRELFRARLDAALEHGRNAHVAIFDVAGLRDINESFGHDAGDDVVREVALRLSAAYEGALVARLGTTDFAVLAESSTSSDELFAERALGVFAAPFRVGQSLLTVECRVGIARSPEHGSTSATLTSAAESAARAAGRLSGGWAVASRTRSQDGAARLQMLADLREALERNELRLHYQPLLDVTSGEVKGFEALMRWQHNGAPVAPAAFIPLAEQTGFIVPLTEWVVKESTRQIAEWARAGRTVRVSINVGAKALGPSSRLETVIARALDANGVSAPQLAIEVTETDLMMDPVQASRRLNALKQLGVRIAMDDFGTGYSSLAYLNQLPLDEVKIDRSFIGRLLRDPQTSSIVRAAIDLSHALGLDAVAEGVEDEATLERLTLLGCDGAQGYLIAKPMPADAVLPWLADRTATPTVVSAPLAASAAIDVAAGAGAATVLVVDDEHSLRVATHRILSSQGYNVLHAATASEALRICTEQGENIDLVVTDIFLTDWRGHELAGRLRETHPDVKFLFVSGDPKASGLVNGAPFLAKPFSKQQLIERVGIVLAA